MSTKKDVKTSGNPDSRLPSHLNYYSIKAKDQHSLATTKQVSEQEFAHTHPTQYKALKLYSYVKKSHNKKPLNKVKNVSATNFSIHYGESKQDFALYNPKDKPYAPKGLILPEIETTDLAVISQAESIAHEDRHTQQNPKEVKKQIKISDSILFTKTKGKPEFNTKITKKQFEVYKSLPIEQDANKAKEQYSKEFDSNLKDKHKKAVMKSIIYT